MASSNKKSSFTENPVVLDFAGIDKTKLVIAGGKGANLGELSRISGIQVPGGFCITTRAYKETIGNNEMVNNLLAELANLKSDNLKSISQISATIRKTIEGTTIPQSIKNEIIWHLEEYSEQDAYAVRSSATAEDLPSASFAGQQDTYLNIIGKDESAKKIF